MSVGEKANVAAQEVEDDVGKGGGKRCEFEKKVEFREAMEEISQCEELGKSEGREKDDKSPKE